MSDIELDYYSPSHKIDLMVEVEIVRNGLAKEKSDETGDWYDTYDPKLVITSVEDSEGFSYTLPDYEQRMVLQIAMNIYWDRYLEDVLV